MNEEQFNANSTNGSDATFEQFVDSLLGEEMALTADERARVLRILRLGLRDVDSDVMIRIESSL